MLHVLKEPKNVWFYNLIARRRQPTRAWCREPLCKNEAILELVKKLYMIAGTKYYLRIKSMQKRGGILWEKNISRGA